MSTFALHERIPWLVFLCSVQVSWILPVWKVAKETSTPAVDLFSAFISIPNWQVMLLIAPCTTLWIVCVLTVHLRWQLLWRWLCYGDSLFFSLLWCWIDVCESYGFGMQKCMCDGLHFSPKGNRMVLNAINEAIQCHFPNFMPGTWTSLICIFTRYMLAMFVGVLCKSTTNGLGYFLLNPCLWIRLLWDHTEWPSWWGVWLFWWGPKLRSWHM